MWGILSEVQSTQNQRWSQEIVIVQNAVKKECFAIVDVEKVEIEGSRSQKVEI